MLRKSLVLAVLSGVLVLTGCPNTASQKQAAQAAQNISIILIGAQKAEIVAYQQHLVPPTDHRFIQQQFKTIEQLGKTTDACILSAGNTKGTLVCLDTAVAAIDNINNDGGTFIKNAKAKADFALAMLSVKTLLVSVETVLGGK